MTEGTLVFHFVKSNPPLANRSCNDFFRETPVDDLADVPNTTLILVVALKSVCTICVGR